jgi:hypothetical protein
MVCLRGEHNVLECGFFLELVRIPDSFSAYRSLVENLFANSSGEKSTLAANNCE